MKYLVYRKEKAYTECVELKQMNIRNTMYHSNNELIHTIDTILDSCCSHIWETDEIELKNMDSITIEYCFKCGFTK